MVALLAAVADDAGFDVPEDGLDTVEAGLEAVTDEDLVTEEGRLVRVLSDLLAVFCVLPTLIPPRRVPPVLFTVFLPDPMECPERGLFLSVCARNP